MDQIIYPKWKYHAEHEPRLVRDSAQDQALGKGWAESPADVVKREPEKAPKKFQPKDGGKA